MIITINTKEDTKDEIKRIIAMLGHMVNEPVQTQDFSLPASEGVFNLFDQPPSETSSEEKKSDRLEIYDY